MNRVKLFIVFPLLFLFCLAMLFLGIFFWKPHSVFAHGVVGEVGTGGIVATAKYSTGEPMSYAKVQISAPGSKLPFQSGRTDRNGHFCFFPDVAGEWKVVVDDEMDHRLEVVVPVDEAMGLKSNHQNSGSIASTLSRYERALMGVSIIFGIFGCLLGLKCYRKAKAENQKG